MGFIARIEKDLDLLEHKSRSSRSKFADPKYTLEDAISVFSKHVVFASKKLRRLLRLYRKTI